MNDQLTAHPRLRDLRMLLPAGLGWATSALGISLRPSFWWVLAGVLLAITLAWLGWRSSQQGFATLITPVLVICVMLGAVALGSLHRSPPELRAAEDSTVELTIRLTQTAMPGATSVRAKIVAVEGVVLRRGSAPARIVGNLGPERLALGSLTTIHGYLMVAEPWEQQSWIVLQREPPEQWVGPGDFLSATDELRADFSARSLQRSGDAGQLLPGLAIGDTSSVNQGLIDAMRITSLSHLVAVSGANCAIVVALVVGIVALLGGGVWLRMIFGVLALVGFVVLVTPEPSIIRASVMASIVLIFLASSRPVRGIPVLGVTVLVLLAIDPWLATDFAFALSVLATAGILVLTGPLVRMLSRYLPTGLALVLALPLAAQVACQPVLILLNPIIPTWAIVANALAAPAAPIATIVGMLACIAGPLAPGVAQVLLWFAWWPAEYIAAIGRVLADTPYSFMPWPPGWWGAIAVAVVGYSAIAAILLPRPRPRWAVVTLSTTTVVALVLVLAGYALPRGILRSSVPTQWSIAQCDVGQGDALLLRLGDSVVMIDTGRDARALKECLSLLRIHNIDLLVITHFDDDHVGAWRVVADTTHEIWVGHTPDLRREAFVADFVAAGIPVTEVHEGHTVVFDHGELRVLWPSTAPLAAQGNDSSIVISLVPNASCQACLSGVFLGDLGEKPQRILQGRNALTPVDVVKVSHHGSADQFPGLYRALTGTIALIGVGEGNTYGHPAEGILRVVQEHSTVVRSDLHGTVTLHKNPSGDIVVWSER